jgi:hypothetical protein
MAVDTEDKRRSALNCGLLSLAVRPEADSDISTADRRHSAGWYRGIETAVDTFFFWRKTGDAAQVSQWKKTGDASGSWVPTGDSSKSWVQEKDYPEEV